MAQVEFSASAEFPPYFLTPRKELWRLYTQFCLEPIMPNDLILHIMSEPGNGRKVRAKPSALSSRAGPVPVAPDPLLWAKPSFPGSALSDIVTPRRSQFECL